MRVQIQILSLIPPLPPLWVKTSSLDYDFSVSISMHHALYRCTAASAFGAPLCFYSTYTRHLS